MKLSLLSILLLTHLTQKSQGCFSKRQGPRQKTPIPDLTDEKDDGQSLTLVYSENIIVPPEEDEDPTDDQAPDIDKKEDLEDLDRIIEFHLDNEVYDLTSIDNDEKYVGSSSNYANPNVYMLPQLKTNSSLTDKLNNLKLFSRFTKNLHSEVEKVSKSKLKDGVVREPTHKDGYRLEGQTFYQIFVVVIVVLAFLLCLLTSICVALLIKIKLINRPKSCKSSKTSLIKELEQDGLWEV